jgi:hypothetical protein
MFECRTICAVAKPTLLVPASSQQGRERGLPSLSLGSCGVFFSALVLFNRCVRLGPKTLSVQLLILLIMFYAHCLPPLRDAVESGGGNELIPVTPNSLSCAPLAYV